MGKKICQPSGVVDVGLAARHVLDVFGVRQHQRKIAITQDVPDRLPIDARRLHDHVGAALGCQPVRQSKKACCDGVERADFTLHRTAHHVPHAGDHCLLVHIQTGAMWIKNFHVSLLTRRRRGIPVGEL